MTRRKLVITLSVVGVALIIGLWLLQKHPEGLPLQIPNPLAGTHPESGGSSSAPSTSVSPQSGQPDNLGDGAQDSSSTSGKSPIRKISIYFSRQQGQTSNSRSVTRPVPLSAQPRVSSSSPKAADTSSAAMVSENPLLGYALLQLLKGPSDEESTLGLYSEIPKGTRMIGFNVTPEKITINLSRQFASGGGSNSMVQRLQELSQTVKEALPKSNTPNAAVYLELEGEPLTLLGGEGITVAEPIVSGKKHKGHKAHAEGNALPAVHEQNAPAYVAQPMHP